MRLAKLHIAGFKSFPDRAELAFDDGVTAIVGPNGCGKSNVVDAITWVLGEQSAKSLRGERMEDVIFSGSDARKPTATAEVRLKLSQVAQAAMQQYNTGALNAADQYALQQWKDQQTAQLNDYMARAGISDSSSHAQMLNDINTQALAQAEKMRQQYLANALSASGTSGQIGANLTNAMATIQASGDQQAAQALQNMLIAMGSIKR